MDTVRIFDKKTAEKEELKLQEYQEHIEILVRNGICPECHSPRLLHESGCVTCPECGWSACL